MDTLVARHRTKSGSSLLNPPLVEISGGKVAGFIFIINLFDLGGKKLLEKKGYKTFSLFVFPIFQEEIERGPQLSAYGEDWNDISDFRTQLEINSDYNVSAILSNPAIIEDINTPSESLLIIAGAESPYSDIELDLSLIHI